MCNFVAEILGLSLCDNLTKKTMNTKSITRNNAKETVRQLYEVSFPDDEKIPWDDLMRLIDEMHLDFTAYYDGDDFIGFTIVYPRPEELDSSK